LHPRSEDHLLFEHDAVEHIQFRDLQHVFDDADLLAARGSDRDARLANHLEQVR
jgi:hypothetical protein